MQVAQAKVPEGAWPGRLSLLRRAQHLVPDDAAAQEETVWECRRPGHPSGAPRGAGQGAASRGRRFQYRGVATACDVARHTAARLGRQRRAWRPRRQWRGRGRRHRVTIARPARAGAVHWPWQLALLPYQAAYAGRKRRSARVCSVSTGPASSLPEAHTDSSRQHLALARTLPRHHRQQAATTSAIRRTPPHHRVPPTALSPSRADT